MVTKYILQIAQAQETGFLQLPPNKTKLMMNVRKSIFIFNDIFE